MNLTKIGILLTLLLIMLSSTAVKVEAAEAYVSVVKIKTFGLNKFGQLSLLASGSGVIIDESGIVVTNSHVVTMKNALDASILDTVYQVCLPKSLNVAPSCDYIGKLKSRNEEKDIALLQIVPISGVSVAEKFPYALIDDSGSALLGDSVTAIGYPDIGGKTVTVTKGSVTGKVSQGNNEWIKIDAIISFGSSGGAALNSQGKFIGITTAISSSYAGTLGYVLDLKSAAGWIGQHKNDGLVSSSLDQRMIDFAKKQNELKTSFKYVDQIAGFSIERTSEWDFELINEASVLMYDDTGRYGGYILLEREPFATVVDLKGSRARALRESSVDGSFGYTNVNTIEPLTLGNTIGNLVVLSTKGGERKYTEYSRGTNLVRLTAVTDESKNDEYEISLRLNTLAFSPTFTTQYPSSRFNYTNPAFSLSVPSPWRVQQLFGGGTIIALIGNDSIPELMGEIRLEKVGVNDTVLTNDKKIEQLNQSLRQSDRYGSPAVRNVSVFNREANKKLSNALNNLMYYRVDARRAAGGEMLLAEESYVVPLKGYYLTLSNIVYSSDEKVINKALSAGFSELVKSVNVGDLIRQNEISSPSSQNQLTQKTQAPKITGTLLQRLLGRIVLQVQSHGEAWYIDPASRLRYYLKDGAVAYEALRKFGLGMSNNDLKKIPIGIETRFTDSDSDKDGLPDKLEEGIGTDPIKEDSDSDGINDGDEVRTGSNPAGVGLIKFDTALANRMMGRIILQVESHGEAWYVNPSDGKRYYMKDGEAAYQIMRFLSLGVTDIDLQKIGSGSL